ncbi:MAG: hypothetical protein AAFV88_16305 [Planctomycetota bacterium]
MNHSKSGGQVERNVESDKTIAILAYRFPPYSGIGAMRVRCLTEHLPSFGWKPIVFTSEWTEDNCDRIDHNCASEILDAVVSRASRLDPNKTGLPGKLRRIALLVNELRNRRRFATETRRAFQQWVRRNGKPDLVLATYPVGACFDVAHQINREFKLPWIADFRDLPDYLHRFPAYAIHRLKGSVASADQLLTVSKPLAETLEARHAKKVMHLPNGYERKPGGTPISRQTAKNSKFTITYTGLLYPPGHPARVAPSIYLDALDQLGQENKIDLSKVAVRLIGTKTPAVKKHFTGRASEKCVEIVEWCEREVAAEEQRNADLLICLGSLELEGIVTGKVFEYINSGTPVLSTPHDKDGVGHVLKHSGAGETVATIEEAKLGILRVYKRWLDPNDEPLQLDHEFIRQFDWDVLTGRFAECCDNLLTRGVDR